MTDRERAIRDRANALMASILSDLAKDPESVDAVDMLLALARGVGLLGRNGAPVTLGPTEVAILVDGAAEMLRQFAIADIEVAECRCCRCQPAASTCTDTCTARSRRARNRHINVSVEQLNYRPARLCDIRRLALRLVEGRTVPGHRTSERLNIVETTMP